MLPDPEIYEKKNPTETAFMRLRKEQNPKLKIKHRYVSYYKINRVLRRSIRLAEDGAFWSHHGISLTSIKDSFWENLKEARFVRGGSTISQQLMKNLFLSPDKTILRKYREFLLTLKLESSIRKKRIFELYMNYIEFGNGIFGVEAACRHYFGRRASQITPFQAVRLAVSIPSPSRYSPFSRRGILKYRTKYLLERLYRYKIINQSQYSMAMVEHNNFYRRTRRKKRKK